MCSTGVFPLKILELNILLPGKEIVLVDAFSRLPRIEGKSAGSMETNYADCYVNFPEDAALRNPLDIEWIQQHQFDDQNINLQHQQNP